MMGAWSDTRTSDAKAKAKAVGRPSFNYRVRFRHGVYPNVEGEATRADIKKYDYFFSCRQTWVGTPNNVDFIDESAQIAADSDAAEHGRASESSRRPARRLIRTTTVERIPEAASRRISPALKTPIQPATHHTSVTTFSSGTPSTASSSPPHATFQHRRHTSPADSSVSSLDGNSSIDWQHDATTSSPFHYIHTSRVPWPLSDPIEAHLFRVFVDAVAPQWDTASSYSVFEKVVPQMALTNSMLLNAVFMVASQMIYRTNAHFPVKPYLYHERVLQGLIPYLADYGRIQDEATLVAAMLLRGFEEVHAGTGGQYHLSTYELFCGPDGWVFDMSSPVVQACFMVHVNFEIYQGLLNQPSLRVDYRNFVLPALESPTDDVAWGNRIVWLCGRILQWTQTNSRQLDEWQTLKSAVDEWELERPNSFNAFFYREAAATAGGQFPELWFPGACHASAHQYLRICHVALAMSDANAASDPMFDLGGSRELEVSFMLKEMMAVARCNLHASTASSIAAHAMHSFAVIMRDPQDQKNVMDFLEEVDMISGWPTEATRNWLSVQWGRPMQDTAGHSNEEYL